MQVEVVSAGVSLESISIVKAALAGLPELADHSAKHADLQALKVDTHPVLEKTLLAEASQMAMQLAGRCALPPLKLNDFEIGSEFNVRWGLQWRPHHWLYMEGLEFQPQSGCTIWSAFVA